MEKRISLYGVIECLCFLVVKDYAVDSELLMEHL